MVPVEHWHFEYFLGKDEASKYQDQAIGKTLLSADGLPMAFGGAYFTTNDKDETIVIAFYYGGPNNYFARKYLNIVTRVIIETARTIREMGVSILYCIADKQILKSDTLIKYFGGEFTGIVDPSGDVYAIHLNKVSIFTK